MSGHVDDTTYNKQVSAVWKATLYLAIITIVEVAIALLMGNILSKGILNSLFAIMSLWKAYYIIGEFMHLKYEKRAFMISLGVPLTFLIWAIIAFAWEGHAWLLANAK